MRYARIERGGLVACVLMCVAGALGFWVLASPAAAQTTYTWTNAADGIFSVPENWSPAGGPPGAADYAQFSSVSPRVSFTSQVENTRLRVAGAGLAVTLDLGGERYDVTGSGTGTSAGLLVGGAAGDARLTVSNGVFETGSFVLGRHASATGTLALGAGAVWTNLITTAGGMRVGDDGSTGILLLSDGAQATLAGLELTRQYAAADTLGRMILSGGETRLHNTGIPYIGSDRDASWNTEGTVRIEDGATWSVQGRLWVRRSGSIEVDNGSLLINTGEGGNDSRIGGDITLSNGAVLDQKAIGSVASGLLIGGTDRVTFRVESQSSATVGSAVDVRNADVVVHGSNSTLTVGERFLVVGDGAATGKVSVAEGGKVTAETLWIGNDANQPGGIVEVVGDQSELSVNTYIYVGGISSAARAPGRLRAADGGKISVGPSRPGIVVWGPGVLEMDGGQAEVGLLEFYPDATFAVTLHTGKTGAPVQVLQTASSPWNSGDIILTDAVFDLSLTEGFTAALEEEFSLIQYAGSRTGMFAGLGEGAIITAYEPSLGTKYEFELSYTGGSGDEVTLTVIPEPGVLALLGLTGLVLLLRRRR